MVRVLTILLWLWCVCADAQFTFTDRPYMVRLASATQLTPLQTIPSMSNWWHYLDLPSTNNFTVTNWVSRTNPATVYPVGAAATTNTPLGVYIARTAGLISTDADLSYGPEVSNSTTCVIFRPHTVTAFDVLYRNRNGEAGSGLFMVRRYSAPADLWRCGTTTEAAAFGPRAADTYCDIVIIRTNGASLTVYTNGVLTAYNNVTLYASIGPGEFGCRGDAADRGLEGYIAEVFYFGTNFSSLNISNFHYYATNAYGFSP